MIDFCTVSAVGHGLTDADSKSAVSRPGGLSVYPDHVDPGETQRSRAYIIARKNILSAWMLVTALAVFGAAPAQAQEPAQNTVAESTDTVSRHAGMLADIESYPDVRDYLAKNQPVQALNALQAHQSNHDNDPNYFYLLGIVAIKAGDYSVAAESLERVVIMQPDNAGAWLDLAIVSTETGNFTSARSYFDHIEAEFSPPSALRIVIARYRDRIAAQLKIRSPWGFHVEAMAGVDSNANSGLQNSVVPLTFGIERVDLILDPAYQARSDTFMQAGAGAHYKQQIGDSQVEAIMSVRQRTYLHEHDFSTLDVNLSTGFYRPTSLGDASFWLHLEHLSLGGQSLMRNIRAAAQIEHPYAGCRLGLGAEAEWRRYVELKTLDADILWAQAGIACDWNIARIPVQTTLVNRIGIDTPTENRPGGRTRRGELIAQLAMPLAWGANAEFSMTLATARDAEGYSPLLEQNAARRLDRHNTRLLLTVPLNASTEFIFVAEDNRFVSNLVLFQQSGKSISVGLRKRF